MKTNHLLLLSLAMSAALLSTACNRDATPAVDTTTPAATEPAPMPAEPMPAPATPAMGNEMSFADMDKNSDGGIAMDELMAGDMLHTHFTTADSDGDGKLSSAEVDKHRADMAAAPAN
ncbi:MAG: hypothetical protein ABIO38_04520 [Luteimonas sp.]